MSDAKCPECKSSEITEYKREATYALPECTVACCEDCDHQWVRDAE